MLLIFFCIFICSSFCFCSFLFCLFYSACVVSDYSIFLPKFKGKPNNKPWFLCENVLHTYACTCTVIYLFLPYMMQWHPVLSLTVKSFSVTSLSLSLKTEHFSLWNPLHQSSPSVSQSHSFSLSFSGPSSPFLTALCLITSYLKWQLTSWGCNGGWLTEKEQQNTHTHNLNPPCTPCSHSLLLSLSHTYIYTHTDLFAPVLIYKRICSSSLLVLRGHQWGYGDTLGGGARTRFTRYCLHTQPAARWKTDGRRHISWVFCCTEDEQQQRAAVGH